MPLDNDNYKLDDATHNPVTLNVPPVDMHEDIKQVYMYEYNNLKNKSDQALQRGPNAAGDGLFAVGNDNETDIARYRIYKLLKKYQRKYGNLKGRQGNNNDYYPYQSIIQKM